MLYWILKWLMLGTIKIFFRRIKIVGKEHIPHEGPLLILANHPSMMMDPIVIASIMNRRVHFMAKGVLFQGLLGKWLLPKLGLIPVHRAQDDPTQVGKNANTFKKCFEHFENNGALLMFPEGISITQRKLQTLKSGAAKLALTAEARNDQKLGLKILIVGLNYANQHQFNQDLFIHIQPPISINDFTAKHEGQSGKLADELTAHIRQQLEEVMISVADEKTDWLVQQIEQFYKQNLLAKRGLKSLTAEVDFSITNKSGAHAKDE